MPLIYVGFDDTDSLTSAEGTGKMTRRFEDVLPPECRLIGVVRQQLLVDPRILYTSHNSAACAIVEAPSRDCLAEIVSRAVAHVEAHHAPESDPGLCVVCADDPVIPRLTAFGARCATELATQEEAKRAARGGHLSGHGGTEDGIIGAAGGVGRTAGGWCGRVIEFGRLRAIPEAVSVKELENLGITVVSSDREAKYPPPADRVLTGAWVRPFLWAGRPVLPLLPLGDHQWKPTIGKARKT
jgi:hypothetical protein